MEKLIKGDKLTSITIKILFAISCILFAKFNTVVCSSVWEYLLFTIIYGLLYFAIFEVVISMFYHGLKTHTHIAFEQKYFAQCIRIMLIFSNVACLIVAKVLIYFNLLPMIFVLISHIIITFIFFTLAFLLLEKYVFGKQKTLCVYYFLYVLIFELIYCAIWGVM